MYVCMYVCRSAVLSKFSLTAPVEIGVYDGKGCRPIEIWLPSSAFGIWGEPFLFIFTCNGACGFSGLIMFYAYARGLELCCCLNFLF